MLPGSGPRRPGAGTAPPAGKDTGDEKLPLRDGDFELSYSRVRALPLFDDITPRMEGRLQGKGGRGAVVLRRFRAGEVICRQGDPGWTAFYLIRNVDLIAIRGRHLAKADAADAELASRAPELLRLSQAERRQRADELERGGGDDELADLLFASAGRPDPGELEAALAEQELLLGGDRADEALERTHPSLRELDATGKRRHAGQIEGTDAPLAALLRDSALAAELRVRAEVTAMPAGKAAAPAPRGALERLKALIASGRHGRAGASDAAPTEQVIGTLDEGALFGEMACLYHAPRAATVRAVRDCYMIELLGHVLRLLLDSKAFRADVDQIFRQRGLAQLLRGIPLLARAPDEAIELLRRGAALISTPPGAAVFTEGDAADSIYVVRTGTVKLVQRSVDDRVLGHRSRGELVGEHDFLAGGERGFTCVPYEHPLDPAAARRRVPVERRVELVRIDRALWNELCALAPAVSEEAQRRTRRLTAQMPAAAAQGASRLDELG